MLSGAFSLDGLGPFLVIFFGLELKGPTQDFFFYHISVLQVQMQMFTCHAGYADFITWTPQQSTIFRVPRNENFMLKTIDTISRFWARHIYPRLTGASLTRMDQEVEVNQLTVKV